MKSRIRHLSLCLALGLASAVSAQTPEPAPLPDEWTAIAQAVDLSLDQIQTLRAIVASREAALAEWNKVNGATAESLRNELKAAQKAQNAETVRALEARLQPLQTERNAIRGKFDAQMENVLRPEQKAALGAIGHYDEGLRLMVQVPDLSDEQKTRLEAAFKEFTLSLGRWDADKSAALNSLSARGAANNQARHEAETFKTDQLAALKKEHSEIQAAREALRAEREQLEADGSARLLAILTPDQCTVVKAKALQQDLESKLRKLNPTPEQLAAVQALCETEAKAVTSIGTAEFRQARGRLQKTIFDKILTEEQRQALSAKTRSDAVQTPPAAAPVPAAP